MILLTDQLAYDNTATINKILELYHTDLLLFKDVRSFSGLIRSLFSGLKLRHQKDVIFCAIGQPEINLLTSVCLFLLGKKVALYLPELYDNRWLARLILKYGKLLSPIVILPSREREKIFCAKYFIPKKTIILTNDAYQDTYKHACEIREGIVYTGVIFPSRPLDRAIQLARKTYPESNIDLYGKGDMEYIEHLCRTYKCRYMGQYMMRDEVSIISKYKFGIISYPMDSLNNAFCAPNKVISYEMAGAKIICDSPNNLRLSLKIKGLLG